MKKRKLTFLYFKWVMKKFVLRFRKRHEWDDDDWNTSYFEFKEAVKNFYCKKYLSATPTKKLIIEWGKEFYQEATKDTHDYWVKTKRK